MASSGQQSLCMQMDHELERHLADMKPYVLKLPYKTDKQKCALWIKKFCEPPVPAISGRKNRNMYAQLLLHMLKRGSLEGPFITRPTEGPLQTLPSHMSVYFDELPNASRSHQDKRVPDWVTDLGDTSSTLSALRASLSSITDKTSIGLDHSNPSRTFGSFATSHTTDHSAIFPSHRPYSSLGLSSFADTDPLSSLSSLSHTAAGVSSPPAPPPLNVSMDDINVGTKKADRHMVTFISPDRSNDPHKRTRSMSSLHDDYLAQPDWNSPPAKSASSPIHTDISLRASGMSSSSQLDMQSLVRSQKSELDVKTKMLESKFHEEKLRLQQKHDAAVQKILDRKNAEIEDVKGHYRQKLRTVEESSTKWEKKYEQQYKDSNQQHQTKDKEISELKRLVTETVEAGRQEFEQKLHNTVAMLEQEKFDMQKQHTRNIQDILEDTNCRLQKMEQEYAQQAISTTTLMKDLESHVQKVTSDAEITANAKATLEHEKADLEARLTALTSQLDDYKTRFSKLEYDHEGMIEKYEKQLQTVTNKCDAAVEHLKQEKAVSSSKASDAIYDLQRQTSELKQALQNSEEQRLNQMRELDRAYDQDKTDVETLHSKKVQSLKSENEILTQTFGGENERLKQQLRDKDAEIERVMSQSRLQSEQSEHALDEFKAQVEKSQKRIYEDMKIQMEKVESDLNRSKHLREKQSHEFSRQIEDERHQHDKEVSELKLAHDQEKLLLLQEQQRQKEALQSTSQKEQYESKQKHASELQELTQKSKIIQDNDGKNIEDLELQNQALRGELVHANQLRKQQLVELGLLREEERQKLLRDHDAAITQLKSKHEQVRLESQRDHSDELENMLVKTNNRLKDLESEHGERSNKSSQTIQELQNDVAQLREDLKRQKELSGSRLSETNMRYEKERKSHSRQQALMKASFDQELGTARCKMQSLEKTLQQRDLDLDEKLMQMKLQSEDKVRGMLPENVRQELENTISSLQSQVSFLQQRALVLEEEVAMQNSSPANIIQNHTAASIKT